MNALDLSFRPSAGRLEISLPASKSESNRALIIQALASGAVELDNLSEARDTQTMIRLLQSADEVWDVLDAGTTMRFLTAYSALQPDVRVMTGTERMQERPIRILVDALRELGAEVVYLKDDGFPPLRVRGIVKQQTASLSIRGDVSSQYISALLLIAPNLPMGLCLDLEGKVGSRPYIEMTLSLMRKFGAEAAFANDSRVVVKPGGYKANSFSVESDWSGASYWYSVAALSEKAEIKLKGLRKDSLQGDIEIVRIMERLGVRSEFDEDGVLLTKIPVRGIDKIDFSDCPDLAQTVVVVAGALGCSVEMTGLESLRIKETDRVAALSQELLKIGVKLIENSGKWRLDASGLDWSKMQDLVIETYDDHRMAMAFAPLALRRDLQILDPCVVNKSYPAFWGDFSKMSL
ncbi:MAG: 3-phosphoshikimate 1-carboxyvinyltransferase [Cytophagales bacterium]|nr:3-phosphoshikimate 1-carboxyvinyltransferase [Cytophagales bacterium]